MVDNEGVWRKWLGMIPALCVGGAMLGGELQAKDVDPGARPGPASSASAPAPVRKEVVRVRPGVVEGVVVGADGKTPTEGVRVRFRDADGVVLSETTTDAEGQFRAEVKTIGAVRLEVGRAVAKLRVDDGATVRSLVLLLPEALARPVHEAQADDLDTISFLGVEMSTELAFFLFTGGAAGLGGGIAGIVLATEGGSPWAVPSPSR